MKLEELIEACEVQRLVLCEGDRLLVKVAAHGLTKEQSGQVEAAVRERLKLDDDVPILVHGDVVDVSVLSKPTPPPNRETRDGDPVASSVQQQEEGE